MHDMHTQLLYTSKNIAITSTSTSTTCSCFLIVQLAIKGDSELVEALIQVRWLLVSNAALSRQSGSSFNSLKIFSNYRLSHLSCIGWNKRRTGGEGAWMAKNRGGKGSSWILWEPWCHWGGVRGVLRGTWVGFEPLEVLEVSARLIRLMSGSLPALQLYNTLQLQSIDTL